MERIPEKIDSKFRFVLLAAQRAEQMMRGARPRVEEPGKATRVGMEEIIQDAVAWDYGPPPVPETELLDGEAEELIDDGAT